MNIRTITLLIVFAAISSHAPAAIHGLVDAADNTASGNSAGQAARAPVPVSAASGTPSTHIFLNAVGIEIAMPGRIIPGISYTRYFTPYVFATIFGGLVADPDGAEVFASINGYRMLNNFFYAGIGFSSIFDKGNSALIGLLNPSAGLMARITPDIEFYAEATAWIWKIRTNENIPTIPDNTILIFKAGVKYYFSWADPLPDMAEMTR